MFQEFSYTLFLIIFKHPAKKNNGRMQMHPAVNKMT